MRITTKSRTYGKLPYTAWTKSRSSRPRAAERHLQLGLDPPVSGGRRAGGARSSSSFARRRAVLGRDRLDDRRVDLSRQSVGAAAPATPGSLPTPPAIFVERRPRHRALDEDLERLVDTCRDACPRERGPPRDRVAATGPVLRLRFARVQLHAGDQQGDDDHVPIAPVSAACFVTSRDHHAQKPARRSLPSTIRFGITRTRLMRGPSIAHHCRQQRDRRRAPRRPGSACRRCRSTG